MVTIFYLKFFHRWHWSYLGSLATFCTLALFLYSSSTELLHFFSSIYPLRVLGTLHILLPVPKLLPSPPKPIFLTCSCSFSIPLFWEAFASSRTRLGILVICSHITNQHSLQLSLVTNLFSCFFNVCFPPEVGMSMRVGTINCLVYMHVAWKVIRKKNATHVSTDQGKSLVLWVVLGPPPKRS